MNYFSVTAPCPNLSRRSAYTLIEISIVLVIIGLLTGSVLAGRAMLRQSHINSVVIDAHKYIGAAEAFKQKYNSLPGDMTKATDYWGAAGGSAPYTTDCYASSGTGTATCNGNGNGQISADNLVENNETLRVWQHLSNAGFIKGSFTGISGYSHIPGTNCPSSLLDGGGYALRFIGAITGYSSVFDGNYGHTLYFSALQVINFVSPSRANKDWALTGNEAMALDAKYDDGLPAQGSVRAFKLNPINRLFCTTGTDSSAMYDISTNDLICSLLFITGF